jgi:hypothetical protein
MNKTFVVLPFNFREALDRGIGEPKNGNSRSWLSNKHQKGLDGDEWICSTAPKYKIFQEHIVAFILQHHHVQT